MDIKKIKSLIELVTSSGIAELEISEKGMSLKIVGHHNAKHNPDNIIVHNQVTDKVAYNKPNEQQNNKKIIYSPMVGTFYRSSSPNQSPFIEIGQTIEAGATVCIIEAMKLMNQIESEFSGIIKTILVKNGSPVEYGQALFEIE